MTTRKQAPAKASVKTAPKPPATSASAKRASATKSASASQPTSASELIDQRIRDLADWRGETLARIRTLILETDPNIIEEVKWMGTPVWSHHGILCTGETYKQVVKLTFAKGAKLPDPTALFNSSLEGNTRRAIDIHEGEKLDKKAFQTLIQSAIELNRLTCKKR